MLNINITTWINQFQNNSPVIKGDVEMKDFVLNTRGKVKNKTCITIDRIVLWFLNM